MNKIKVLAIIEGIQEDYMSDMIWLALCNDNEIEFRSNIYPNYFFKNYLKIQHPVRGLIPFDTFPFQDECVDKFNDHRFNIVLKSLIQL